ncbi:ATP-binding cassette domain-containing protein [Nannocystis poenicansa]|uniref:ATP-binding cassette domain-containing protein n=2 Tax=Nannocystis punicea TaxID=2995304 RepID=A0ABY7HJS9_9BACT|nr:ATP-binding cassette domain-containing protein [Nannocystis poenicansa]
MIDLADRLEGLADQRTEASTPPQPFASLALRGVSYRYEPRDDRAGFAVGPCDLELVPGEVVFVTGANGSGKSTFIKLLCGLYRRHGGELRVDGEALPADPGPAWRSRFAAVFAEVALFERLYGIEDVDPARVAALLEEMELGHKVRFEDGRFTTVDLSTGQRKRLALIVALLADRPIYVFDEWAADQDPHFREAFYRRILPSLRARGKTVVAVTHDDDAFDACDRRFHFHGGRMEPVCA